MKSQIEWHYSRCHGECIAHFKVVEARKRVRNENCHQDAILLLLLLLLFIGKPQQAFKASLQGARDISW